MKKQIYHSLVFDDTQVRYLMSGTGWHQPIGLSVPTY